MSVDFRFNQALFAYGYRATIDIVPNALLESLVPGCPSMINAYNSTIWIIPGGKHGIKRVFIGELDDCSVSSSKDLHSFSVFLAGSEAIGFLPSRKFNELVSVYLMRIQKDPDNIIHASNGAISEALMNKKHK